MRHRKRRVRVGKKRAHVRALLCQLSGDLLRLGAVTTTSKRASALRSFLNPLFRLARAETLASRRRVIGMLRGNRRVYQLLRDYLAGGAEKDATNFLRLTPLPPRSGDAAPLVRVELLQFSRPGGKKKKGKDSGKGRK